MDKSKDEAHLLERVRQSDQEAFRCLFERFQPVLFRNILPMVSDNDAAHDIVQEAFVRVWNHRSSLQPNRPVLAYLFRISRNLVKDAAKRASVRRRLEADIPDVLLPQESNPEESARTKILEEKLAQVIRTKLPEKCRQVFLLSRMEGMANAEISKQLGISVKTVENQITRGLKILRRHLRQYLGEFSKH